MHVCGNNYTAPHQSVTSSAIITKYPKNNTIIAIVEFNYSLLGLLCVLQTHDLSVSSIMCMVALDFQLKSFITLHNTTMKQDEKLH